MYEVMIFLGCNILRVFHFAFYVSIMTVQCSDRADIQLASAGAGASQQRLPFTNIKNQIYQIYSVKFPIEYMNTSWLDLS